MSKFLRLTEIAIVYSGSGSGLIDYWTEHSMILNVDKILKAKRKCQSRIRGQSLTYTTISLECGDTVDVLEPLSHILKITDGADNNSEAAAIPNAEEKIE